MKVIVVSCFFVSLITLHQKNLSIKQENVLIYFGFTYQLNTLPETMQQILPPRGGATGDQCNTGRSLRP